MKIKNNYKRIFLLLILVVVVCTALNCVHAQINGSTELPGTLIFGESANESSTESKDQVLSAVSSLAIAGVKLHSLPIIWILNLVMLILTVILMIGMWVIVGATTGSWQWLPWADNIVYNRVLFLDANFIKPSDNSILAGAGDVFGKTFNSFLAIAMAIFIISAMVNGLKMALSSIASKKAVYKESALKWVSSFLILICLRWILAGAFYINEQVVASLYDSNAGALISISFVDAIPRLWGNARYTRGRYSKINTRRVD